MESHRNQWFSSFLPCLVTEDLKPFSKYILASLCLLVKRGTELPRIFQVHFSDMVIPGLDVQTCSNSAGRWWKPLNQPGGSREWRRLATCLQWPNPLIRYVSKGARLPGSCTRLLNKSWLYIHTFWKISLQLSQSREMKWWVISAGYMGIVE